MEAKDKLMNSQKKLKTELAYSKVEHLLSTYYEKQLEKEISKIFSKMNYKVIENLAEYYNQDVMFAAHMDLILSPIHEMHKEYYETILKYKIREFDKARASGKRIVERTIKFKRKGDIINKQFTVLKADINDLVSSSISKDKLFGTSRVAHENLANRTFALSEKTLSRVDAQINDIIQKGYETGDGVNVVAKQVGDRFNQLKTWESRRIARTEIHNSQSLGIIQGYNDMGVEYIEWSAAHDNRVRDSHIHLDGEIIRLGGVFSNGLMYPGDMAGPAAEIINCRCQALPFIIPYGYIAPPDMAQFKEDDLIATLDYFNADDLIAQVMSEPEIEVVEGFDKYTLNESQLARYNELKAKDELGFLDRRELKTLENQIRYNELNNKLLTEGNLPRELEKEYDKLQSILGDKLVKPQTVVTKPSQKVFEDKTYFNISKKESVRRQELIEKQRNGINLTIEEKEERRLIALREDLSGYHQKLLTEGLNEEQTNRYIRTYNQLKKYDSRLPELSENLKFTTPAKSYHNNEYYRNATQFKLNKTEADELYKLEKKQLLNKKLTSSELKRLEELQTQEKFIYLNAMNQQAKGLSYDDSLEFKKLYKQLKTKLKLDNSILKQEVTGYKSDIPLDKKAKDFKKFKGTTDDGLLPNGEKIKDYFTKDARLMTDREQQVAQRWLGSDYKAFTNFEVDCDRNVKKFEKWIYNAAKAYEKDPSLLYYKYYYKKK